MYSEPFLRASLNTIECILHLNEISCTSEVTMLQALQRYMKINKFTLKSLDNELHLALKGIRFLNLTADEIAHSTLLTGDEARLLISCLSKYSDASKIPTKFSISRENRAKQQVPEFRRELNALYMDNFCYYCIKNKNATFDHSIVHCPSWANPMKSKLIKVYNKYRHCELHEYETDDIHVIFGVFNVFGWIK